MNEQSDNTRKNILREAQRQIVRSAFFALAALAVIVFACYAWFVSSGTVTGKVGAVRINGSSFELGSVGEQINTKSMELIPPENTEPGEDWKVTDPGDGKITGSKSNILWRVTSGSNLGNHQDMTGISPGSDGTLAFYVIPKKEGPLNIKFNISLSPLDHQNQQITYSTNSTLNNLLRGHFLFFYSCADAAGNPQEKLLRYDNHSFSLTFPNASVDIPILVTIKWLWPEFLRDVIDNDTIGTDIRAWIEATPSESVTPSAYFFYNGGNEIGKVDDVTADFRMLNSYYNNADEYIGSLAKGVILSLTAEEF